MRFRRIIPKNTAIYHCMSRTVAGEAFFNQREKEVFRKMIAQAADFSGVQVLTFCVMNNHFHLLVRVTPVEALSDAELERRFAVLYPKPTKFQAATLTDFRRKLAAGGPEAEAARAKLLARMGDVSEFMKTLKQRFSIWFNKSRDRFGPVWSDRFKSVLVEGKGFALQTVAAYIDLNPVRAGLVSDPKDYRFCGYAAAVAGNADSVEALRLVFFGDGEAGQPKDPEKSALQAYRQLLFGKGSSAVAGAANISRAEAVRVLEKQDGVLPLPTVLRCRIRFITEGAVLGSREFVESYLQEWKIRRERKYPPKIQTITGSDDAFTCINGRRGRAFS